MLAMRDVWVSVVESAWGMVGDILQAFTPIVLVVLVLGIGFFILNRVKEV